MSYYSYSIYGGDETQTKQIDYMKHLKISKNEDVLLEYLKCYRTLVPKQFHDKFFMNFDSLFKKINKNINNEDIALEWVLIAKLYIDNKLKFPKKLKEMSLKSINYLIDLLIVNVEGWQRPSSRRKRLVKIKKQIQQRKIYNFCGENFYN